MANVLAVDVGTMSMRTSIYNDKGQELYQSAYEYSAIYLPEGQVEQDTADWKNALEFNLKNIGEFIKENSVEIEGISVTSQRASVIPITNSGRPLYNAITWQDKRSIGVVDELLENISMKEIFKKTGLRANPYFSLPKMLWIKERAPLMYKETDKFIGVQDYVVYLLTKKFVTDASQAARTMLMNIETFDWDEDMLEISGITKDYLPELKKPGSVAGDLVDYYQKLLNIDKAVPVIMAGGDQQNAALALNVFKEGQAEANTGTGSFVIAHVDKPVFDEDMRVLCSASAVPGKWILEASIFNSGSTYRWFRNNFYSEQEANYEFMNEEASTSIIGANGVMLIPHFEGSAAPFWNSYAKGLFFNLSLGTTRGDMARAILEGIAIEIANNLSLMESVSGKLDAINVAGGLTRSDLFNQIQSDISYRPITKYENSEASSLGAVMSAFVTLGMFESYEEAFRKIVSEEEQTTYTPKASNHLKYNRVAARKAALYNTLNEGQVYEKFMDEIG